ncbi:ABC transporter ATP-binding protein [Sneathiella marina]|uniref:ABC transporter ATP-binding protein n=1 Tax=Sneathiella marina TaxID=2950108 RepID=A0ABY4W3U6_9PROT|nr:ABC transporter ATP-binding protein [Sneathiella marina]USG61713.1 ABC transporter ATP-binding protein [Sneathiella marina]
MTEIHIEKLTKQYGKNLDPAVESLSLIAESGKMTVILGPSGCGKSTVLKAIAGLISPDQGDIRFDGKTILSTRPERRNAVMMFQDHLLFPYMNVGENVGFGLKMRKRAKGEIQQQVLNMLDRVQLSGLEHRKPSELSGGQQQRVALARALIVKPDVLLLDEPLSNLDAHLRLEMRDLIKTLQQEMRITTLFVTHDQEEAVILGDKLALMLNGKLRQTGKAEDFYNRPEDQTVARFFGGRNFIAGLSSNNIFTSSISKFRLLSDCIAGTGVITIRPENVTVDAPANAENSFSALLVKKTYLGTQTRLHFTRGSENFEALVNPEAAHLLSDGQEVRVAFPKQSLWMLN